MPIKLLHGPAGGGKSRSILKQLSTMAPTSFKMIVPHNRLAQHYQREWVSKAQLGGAFFQDSFLTFDDFLLKWLKLNEPRVHPVDQLFVKNVLRRIIHEAPNNLFRTCLEYSEHINELASIIIRLGQCGLNAFRARQFFKNNPELMPLVNILREYEIVMKNLHAYDPGLLTTAIIDYLDQDSFKWFDQITHLMVDRIFPMGPGQREIFYRLSQKRPELDITIAYSMDYDGSDNPYLYHSYTALGEIAASEEYFHLTKKMSPIQAHSFMHPSDEIKNVIAQIETLLNNGTQLSDITVVVPPIENYHHRLNYLMSAKNMAHTGCQLRVEEQTKDLPLTELAAHWQTKNPTSSKLHQAEALKAFEDQWAFCQSLIFNDSIPSDLIAQWAEQERKNLTFEIANHHRGIQILTLPEASSLNTHHLFVVGFSQESALAHVHENRLIPMDHLSQTEMIETFGGPKYRMGVLLRQWQDLLQRNTGQINLSFARHDWNGRDLNPPHLFLHGSNINYSPHATDSETPAEQEQKVQPEVLFPKRNQNTFSISEIETYFKCPFQYYARYHLRLEELDEPSPDIRGDVSGRLIHRALDKLYGDNLDLYLEASVYSLYRNRFKALIPDLVRKLAGNDVALKKSPQVIVEDYIERAVRTLTQLVDFELDLTTKKIKNTQPHLFEWAFGRDKVAPLHLAKNGQEIFITGRIDRVDVNRDAGYFSVIDYKTGKLPTGISIRNGMSPQVPLYMMAVKQQLFPDLLPTSGLLIGLKEIGKNTGLVIADSPEEKILFRTSKIDFTEWENLNESVTEKIIEAARQINEGHFAPAPLSPDECKRCGYASICHYRGDESLTEPNE